MTKMTTTALLLASIFCSAAHANSHNFTMTSPQIKANQTMPAEQIFSGFGCQGGNLSPELNWQNPPVGTKSFAVSVYDPAAPTGSGWWHWMVFNIPTDITRLPSGITEAGHNLPHGAVQARNDFGLSAYGGACPPVGDAAHPYIFTVYALSVDKLPLDSNTPPAMVGYMINSNLLGKATFTSYYQR